MAEGTRNFFIGLASSIALLGLAGLLMSFGELDPLIRKRYQVTLHTDNAGGLRAGSTVEFQGVPIGVVDSVTTQENVNYPVRIVAFINKKEKVPADVQPFVSLPLIGSTAVLQLKSASQPGDPAIGYLPDNDRAEIFAPIRGGMFAELTEQLDQRMRPLMESLEKFNRLSDTFIAVGESLNSLMEEQSDESLSDGQPPNLRTAIVRLNIVLENAQQSLELANSFLGDEQLRADARGAVSKATALIDQATAAIDRYAKLAQSVEGNANDVTQRLLPVLDQAALTLEEVRRVAKLASSGEGTVGQLLNNPDLYKSLDDAAVRLDRTLLELQILIEQLKAEGVIINF